MSFSSTTARVQDSGNGSTVDFPVTFPFQADADLAVVVTTAGVDAVKTLNTDYTVSGEGTNGGGNVRFVTAPASGTTITIYRDLDLNQTRSFTYNGSFPTPTVTAAADKAMQGLQQVNEKVKRTFRISETSPEIAPLTVADRAGKVPAFDASGNPTLIAPTITAFPYGAPYSVSTIASLKAVLYLVVPTGTQVSVAQYATAGDGGGGLFTVDKSDTTTADNGGTVIVANDGTRLKRLTNGELNPRWFGATGNGVSNDRAAFVAMAAAIPANGADITIPPGIYSVAGAGIEFTKPVKIIGSGKTVTTIKGTSTLSGSLFTINASGNAGENYKGWIVCDLTLDSTLASSPQYALTVTGGCNEASIARAIFAGGLNIESAATSQFEDLRCRDAAICLRYNGDNGAGNRFSNIFITGYTSYGFDFQRTTASDAGATYMNKIIIESPGVGAVRDMRIRSTSVTGTPIFVFADQIIADRKGLLLEGGDEFYISQSWFGTDVAGGSAVEVAGTLVNILRFANTRFLGGTDGDIKFANSAAVSEFQATGCRFAGATRAFNLGTSALISQSCVINNNWYNAQISNSSAILYASAYGGVVDTDAATVVKPNPIADKVWFIDKTSSRIRLVVDSSISIDCDSGGQVAILVNGTPKMIMTSGKINMSIPTSSAGLSSGDIWNDSGTVKMV